MGRYVKKLNSPIYAFDVISKIADTMHYGDMLDDYSKFFDLLPNTNRANLLSRPIRKDRLENKVVVTFEVPGYSKQDLKVQADGSYLTVEAAEKDGNKALSMQTYCEELESAESITASCEHGLLKVTITYRAPVRTKQVEIT